MNDRELRRMLENIAGEIGTSLIAIERTGGNHRRVRFSNGAVLFCSATPSDWRVQTKIRSQARRILRMHRAA
jgi:hypothetical protein